MDILVGNFTQLRGTFSQVDPGSTSQSGGVSR